MHQVIVGSLVLVVVDMGLGFEGRVVGTEGRSKGQVCCSLLSLDVVVVGIGEVGC